MATINVTANSPPQLNISGSQTICSGSSANLTVAGGDNYLWSNQLTGTSIMVAPFISTGYLVTATVSNGCTTKSEGLKSVFGHSCLLFTLHF